MSRNIKNGLFLLLLLLPLTPSVHAQEVPFVFTWSRENVVLKPTLFRVVLFNAVGDPDTLVNTTLRFLTPSNRLDKKYAEYYISRRITRSLPVQDSCRLFFQIDSDTLLLAFPVETSSVGYGIHARLSLDIDSYDSAVYRAYPTVNVYRSGDSLVHLYYCGLDTPSPKSVGDHKPRPVFNLVNATDKPIYSGNSSLGFQYFIVIDDRKADNNPFFLYGHDWGDDGNVLPPHRFALIPVKRSWLSPGGHRIYVVYSFDSYMRILDCGGCIAYRGDSEHNSVWRHPKVQTWYVSSQLFFLTTLDLNPE